MVQSEVDDGIVGDTVADVQAVYVTGKDCP
jgi:hypothetical protein